MCTLSICGDVYRGKYDAHINEQTYGLCTFGLDKWKSASECFIQLQRRTSDRKEWEEGPLGRLHPPTIGRTRDTCTGSRAAAPPTAPRSARPRFRCRGRGSGGWRGPGVTSACCLSRLFLTPRCPTFLDKKVGPVFVMASDSSNPAASLFPGTPLNTLSEAGQPPGKKKDVCSPECGVG